MNVAVLMTCHNRREKTLRCLRALAVAAHKVKSKSEKGKSAESHVFLVDDGSTDGTGEAVRNVGIWEYENEEMGKCENGEKSEWVRVIKGDGKLFWAKGMALAWRSAQEWEAARNGVRALPSAERRTQDIRPSYCQPSDERQQTDFRFSHYLWLNDDVELLPDALATLFQDCQSVCAEIPSSENGRRVIVGFCRDADGQVSYGATDEKNRLMSPMGRPVEARGWFSGNVVLVPRQVCEEIGIIDEAYTHARADFDYAERLKRAGIPFFASSKFVGVCTSDWSNKMRGRSLVERLASLWRPGYHNLHDLWLIRSRYHGRLRAILSCLHMVLMVLRRVK